MESYDFKLVRKALAERRMLLAMAPHRVCFVLKKNTNHEKYTRRLGYAQQPIPAGKARPTNCIFYVQFRVIGGYCGFQIRSLSPVLFAEHR